MALRKTYLRLVALTVVVLTVAVWTTRRSDAIIITGTMPAHFGPLSLARGQALRFYLANAAMEDLGTMPQPCVADVMVYDVMGMMVTESHHEVPAGETKFFDVFFEMLPRMSRENKVVLRLVADVAPPDPDMDMGLCIGTAEVFNRQTGESQIFLGGPDTMPR